MARAARTPPPASTRPLPPARSRAWWWALLAALLVVAGDAWRQGRHFAAVSRTFGVAVSAPAFDAKSPTGYADGRRVLVLPARAVDGGHWIMQTQQMLATGTWRVRQVDYDNAPAGRAVHWASPYRWWLGLLAYLDHAVSGRPLGASVEYAALYSNPLLFGALLLGVVPFVARRLGAAAAGWLALAMVATVPFSYAFAAANPDHHGLIQASAMLAVILLVGGGAGWTRSGDAAGGSGDTPGDWLPAPRPARRCFLGSALAGALGMWVSAAGTIPVLGAIALGALGSARLARRAPAGARFDSSLWRQWGIAGAAASLLAYLVEYAPVDFGWRLEVNHPLYAIAWLGGGELLCRVTRAVSERHWRWSVREWGMVAGAIACVLAPVGLILGRGTAVFAVADPFLWSLSNDYVVEGQGLVGVLRRAGLSQDTVAQVLPMLLVVPAIVVVVRRGTAAPAKAVLTLALAATGLFWLLALAELRWWTVGFACSFGLLVVLAAIIERSAAAPGPRWASRLAGAGLFAPGLIATVIATVQPGQVSTDDIRSLVERDLAHALRQRTGDDPGLVLATPTTSSRLAYFGGVRVLGTTYWENLDGMKRAAAIFAAASADEAQRALRAAGVTYVVGVSWDDFAEPYARLARGMRPGATLPAEPFGVALARTAKPPAWLRRLPDHLPAHPWLADKSAAIFEVTDRTAADEVLVRQLNYLLDRGSIAAAADLRPELEKHPGRLGALVARARLSAAQRDEAGFVRVLPALAVHLDQAASLEDEDRVHLGAVLAIGGEVDRARAELQAVVRDVAARDLRRLPPGALMDLLALTDELQVTWPDERRRAFALSLVPPDRRR